MTALPATHKTVRLHPTDHSIHVDTIPTPQVQDPDDAIVKVKYAGLCGSDLHGYRGHEEISNVIVTGHEFLGEIVALGKSYSPSAVGRPPLYSTLSVGDKVVAPFTSSCAECHFCRIGFTSRCAHQLLFGTEALPGGQAQYVRVPKAGGTLFVLESRNRSSTEQLSIANISDTSLLLLADILPTGCFAALQTLQHPKILPVLTGQRFPLPSLASIARSETIVAPLLAAPALQMTPEDQVLTLAIVGLGPVGICALVSLLDMLSSLGVKGAQLVAIDIVSSRLEKAQAVYNALTSPTLKDIDFKTASPDEATRLVSSWTNDVGCNAVLEVVGNNSALTLSYNLVRPFGVIVSVGVHQSPQVPFTGRQLYSKNIAFEFGRCPVRALFPLAVDVLSRHQSVFGSVGEPRSLVDLVVGIDQAAEMYSKFDKGEVGKVILVP